MAGRFEVFQDPEGPSRFRFRLRADDGSVIAISESLGSIKAVKAAITAVRENAATGFIVDMRT